MVQVEFGEGVLHMEIFYAVQVGILNVTGGSFGSVYNILCGAGGNFECRRWSFAEPFLVFCGAGGIVNVSG